LRAAMIEPARKETPFTAELAEAAEYGRMQVNGGRGLVCEVRLAQAMCRSRRPLR